MHGFPIPWQVQARRVINTCMDYKFWVNDFPRVQEHKLAYPKASKIFDYPVSAWFGVSSAKLKFNHLHSRVNRLLDRAAPATPVMVMYNLPDRDIGQHSKGGAISDERYLAFMRLFAQTIGDRAPIVIFEPDGLPHSTIMDKAASEHRLDLMKAGIEILTSMSKSIVYVDIGHSNWLDAETAAGLIDRVASPDIRGFSVNVSNFRTTEESMRWSLEVGEYTKHNYFVIDTSRNGNGPYGNEWCNPPGRALGHPATTDTGNELCDAFLWIKIPGESDGTCNGGPNAGNFWAEYARDLVDNTDWI